MILEQARGSVAANLIRHCRNPSTRCSHHLEALRAAHVVCLQATLRPQAGASRNLHQASTETVDALLEATRGSALSTAFACKLGCKQARGFVHRAFVGTYRHTTRSHLKIGAADGVCLKAYSDARARSWSKPEARLCSQAETSSKPHRASSKPIDVPLEATRSRLKSGAADGVRL